MSHIDRIRRANSRRNRRSRNRIRQVRSAQVVLKPPEYESFKDSPFPEDKTNEILKVDVYENIGRRPLMEDFHSIELKQNASFIGVYDGHAGKNVAKYVSQNLYETITKIYDEQGKSLEEAIVDGFQSIENTLYEKSRRKKDNVVDEGETQVNFSGGSCASIAFIKNTEMVTANIGDCKMVLFDVDGKYEIMTENHDVNNEKEIQRINDMGFKIRKGSRIGMLNITRSFGDFFRPKGLELINACPHVRKVDLDFSKHKFFVAASDGLWKNITEDKVFEIVSSETDPRIATRRLMAEVCKDLKDNITITVVYFQKS